MNQDRGLGAYGASRCLATIPSRSLSQIAWRKGECVLIDIYLYPLQACEKEPSVMARKAFNPNWKKDGDWQVITAIPADASDTTKRLFGIARRANGVEVLSSPKFPSMLRVRYSDPPYALMTIRSFNPPRAYSNDYSSFTRQSVR